MWREGARKSNDLMALCRERERRGMIGGVALIWTWKIMRGGEGKRGSTNVFTGLGRVKGDRTEV